MELGAGPAANMLPEVAYIKLGWTLGQTADLKLEKSPQRAAGLVLVG